MMGLILNQIIHAKIVLRIVLNAFKVLLNALSARGYYFYLTILVFLIVPMDNMKRLWAIYALLANLPVQNVTSILSTVQFVQQNPFI
jgi:hypothetical protein